MKPKIVVIGSVNTDMVIMVNHLPNPGETVLGHGFMKMLGGKGANQAVAAARLDAEVTLVARFGKDAEGENAVHSYKAEGINLDYITYDDDAPSGAALIIVNSKGENVIAVAPGANNTLSPDDVKNAETAIRSADCVLLQLEIPLESVETGIKLAKEHNVPVILNPAPAQKLPDELIKLVDVLTPNETEAAILTGDGNHFPKSVRPTSPKVDIKDMAKKVVITQGADGALIAGSRNIKILGFKVDAIDATGAGDAFNGSLAVALARGDALKNAVIYANAVGALTTTKVGAQSAMPYAAEVEAFLAAFKTEVDIQSK